MNDNIGSKSNSEFKLEEEGGGHGRRGRLRKMGKKGKRRRGGRIGVWGKIGRRRGMREEDRGEEEEGWILKTHLSLQRGDGWP